MDIIKKEVTQANQQRNGKWRAHLRYTFANGAIKTKLIMQCDSLAHAESLLIDHAAVIAFDAQQQYESEKVLATAIIKDYTHATADQIAAAYLREAMRNDTTFEAYLHLTIAMQYLSVATDSAVRARLKMDVQSWADCKARFTFLDAKSWKVEIANYLQTQQEDSAQLWRGDN